MQQLGRVFLKITEQYTKFSAVLQLALKGFLLCDIVQKGGDNRFVHVQPVMGGEFLRGGRHAQRVPEAALRQRILRKLPVFIHYIHRSITDTVHS